MKIINHIYRIVAFDELALFQISFAYVFTLVLNPSVAGEIFSAGFEGFASFLLLLALGLPFLMGLIFSLKHLFISREKTSRELWLMITSATLINAVISYYALKYNTEQVDYKIIFPIVNVVQAVLILWFLGLMSKDNDFIYFFYLPGNTNLWVAIFNLVVISILVLFFHYYLESQWYYTISSAISWTVFVSKFLRFGTLKLE